MFAVGDKVVYPMHGAGVIAEVVERDIDGVSVEYVVLRMLHGNMKVLIPKQNLERVGVRHIVDEKVLAKVEIILQERPENDMKSITWNRRFNLYLGKMKSGDIFEVADVVRTLAIQENLKKLSTGERRLLNSAKQILLSEVMMVQSCDEAKSEAWLMRFFQ